MKIHFLVDLSFVSLHFDKSNLCWVEEFLLCKDRLEQGSEIFDHWKKKVVKKSTLKPQGGFLFNCEIIKTALHRKKTA